MIESIDINFKKSRKVIIRNDNNIEEVITEKSMIQDSIKDIKISKKDLDKNVTKELSLESKNIRTNLAYTPEVKKELRKEFKTEEYKKSMKDIVRNRMIDKNAREVGREKFNNLMVKLNSTIAKEING